MTLGLVLIFVGMPVSFVTVIVTFVAVVLGLDLPNQNRFSLFVLNRLPLFLGLAMFGIAITGMGILLR